MQVKQQKRGKRKKKAGNNDRRFLFLNETRGKDNRGGQSYILDLKLRSETGRRKSGEGDQIGNVSGH